MANFTIPYITPANYTYDTSKIEVDSGIAKLKDIRPLDATFGANYDTNINATWGNGILTGNPQGTINIVGGKLDLTGYSYRWLDYNANLNADSQQTGCIRFKVTPNYSGNPSSYQEFFAISKGNGNHVNSIDVFHASNGYIYVTIKNETGSIIYQHNLNLWQPTAGIEYEFEFNYDLTLGFSRLFIEGNQHGVTIVGSGIRSLDTSLLRIGNSTTSSSVFKPNFYMNDLIIFSTVQHTSNYTPGYTITNIYSDNKPTIYKTNGDGVANIAEWISFSETVGGGNTGVIRYQLSGNGTDWLYWNGTFWASAGVSDYNTEAECEAHMLDFTASYSNIYVKAFLISNGLQQVELDENQIGYVTNTAPSVYAGLNKTAIYNTIMSPFSDCLFSDLEGNIVKAEWKEEGGSYAEIPQGAYSTLLEAVRAFNYTPIYSDTKTIYLKITDSYDIFSIDNLIINVNQVPITVNVKDIKGNHLFNVNFNAGDSSSSSVQNSPFSFTFDIGAWTSILSKNYFNTLSESNTINISTTELNFIMSTETRIDELIVNIDAPIRYVKGDTFTFNGTINTILTNYKIRCQLSDKDGNSIKLATVNSGGSNAEIEIYNALAGEFIIVCNKDLTTNFKKNVDVEIEIENSSGQVRTIFKETVMFEDENLDWTTP